MWRGRSVPSFQAAAIQGKLTMATASRTRPAQPRTLNNTRNSPSIFKVG